MKKCLCKYLFLIGGIAVTVCVIRKMMCCHGMDMCKCKGKFGDLAKDAECEAKKLGKDVKNDLKNAAKDVMCDVKDAAKDVKDLASDTIKDITGSGKNCCGTQTN